MKNLSIEEATALCEWAKLNQNKNWGVWFNYPITGCSYLQFDNNPLVVKFDQTTSFGTLKFKRIGWNRRIPGSGPSITFANLMYEIESIKR